MLLWHEQCEWKEGGGREEEKHLDKWMASEANCFCLACSYSGNTYLDFMFLISHEMIFKVLPVLEHLLKYFFSLSSSYSLYFFHINYFQYLEIHSQQLKGLTHLPVLVVYWIFKAQYKNAFVKSVLTKCSLSLTGSVVHFWKLH